MRISCNLCDQTDSILISVINKRPTGETDYKILAIDYYREIRKCNSCGVYFNSYRQGLLTDNFYEGFYNTSIDTGMLAERFEKIIAIPFEKSDNKQRVKRILDFLASSFGSRDCFILDVGTGTGVFVYELLKFMPNIYCVDPDPQSILLVKERSMVKEAWIGSLAQVPREHKFDLITFNKVLEHVYNPIEMLQLTRHYLSHRGVVYIELPYASNIVASDEQEVRAEFFIEHLTIYTRQAMQYLAEKSEFKVLELNDLIEPSGKHTIYMFLQPK